MDSIRRTLVHVLIMLMLFGLYLVFTGNQVRADRASCDQDQNGMQECGLRSRRRSSRRAVAAIASNPSSKGQRSRSRHRDLCRP